ncbi:hypothetical protein CONLIGDRAFT_647607 [Coniochaeta ligniaria NRRL 30616]|uniref:Amine oxidase domain-containing protein n=1 Tax=Coniochaeta ligniaria NRRL 30616 TaxID=1408157 RepID=A0A1J7IEI9_9PEZI|nr:hypothetical protein CONLIGDRAFT_647607 [Coniochaeta ligniaria NRRL 30616]
MAPSVDSQCRKKVAIVGSGSAGIAALWALNRTHHDVYLYEAAARLGGHTNTVEWKFGKYKTLVDTGFTLMNTAAYPNFLNFLEKVHVRTAPAELAVVISRDQDIFEWAGTNPGAIFRHRRNLLSPRMWRMVFDITRFNLFALDVLISDDIDTRSARRSSAEHRVSAQETIGQYLDREGYSDAFRDYYLIPMTSAVWSMSPGKYSLELPAVTLIRSLWNHRLLSMISSRPQWLTIPEGSKAYVDAVMRGFPSNHRFLNTAVRAVTNDDDGRVRLHLDGGRSEIYDHVILATHGDQAYSIIEGSATPEEMEIMSKFRTLASTAILHADASFMPRSRKTWSSWNSPTRSSPRSSPSNMGQVSLTYNMNILQHIPEHIFGNVLVTLSPHHDVDPKTVQGRYEYGHPLYNVSTSRAQQGLARIQNTRGISYAGAWTRFGLLEDGFTSGLYVAQEHLGAKLPFRFTGSTLSHGKKPELGLVDLVLRLLIVMVQVLLVEVIDRAVESYRAKTSRLRNAHVDGWSGTMKHKKVYPESTGQRSEMRSCRDPAAAAARCHNLRDSLLQRLDTSAHHETANFSTPHKHDLNLDEFQFTRRLAASRDDIYELRHVGPCRPASSSSAADKQHAAGVRMDQMRAVYKQRNRTTMFYTLSIILGTVAFSYGSVPFYKMICQTTGWGGQPVRAPGHGGASDDGDLTSRLQPVEGAKRIRVTFNASVSDVLPWKFVPQQREVRVLPGETALAFYTATNKSDQDIIGVATYSVTPGQVAPYFSKIQCFCFEEQRLNAGETVDMPVFFYLDPDMLNDLNMKGIETVTLSYTFFKAKYDNNGNFKAIAQS